MHPHPRKKLALTLAPLLALSAASLQAQTFTAPLQASTTGSNPVDFEFRADGTLISKSNNNGAATLLSTDQGAGTRLLWFASLGAFRAGTITSANPHFWDQANIGQNSVAMGWDVEASGPMSTAFGLDNVSSGYASTAFGYQNTVSGGQATAGGYGNTASGGSSTAFGQYNTATGSYAVALGYDDLASGTFSLAVGAYTVASGGASTAAGTNTTASAYASFAIGRNNVGGGNAAAWVATDPLFEVGNGPGGGATPKADALVVYKNGSAVFQGVVTVAPGGDIPMYTGN